MTTAIFLLILLTLISITTATINPSKNKKVKKAPEVKQNTGPYATNVFERDLVDPEPLASSIVSEANTYFIDTSLRNFNGMVLGYVTPVS